MPYVCFGRVGKFDIHQPKERKDDPDVWTTEEKPELIVLDLSENHRDVGKIRYYIKKGFKVLKWLLPQNEKYDPESGRSSFREIEELLQAESENAAVREELAALRAEKSALEQKVDERKDVRRAEREAGKRAATGESSGA